MRRIFLFPNLFFSFTNFSGLTMRFQLFFRWMLVVMVGRVFQWAPEAVTAWRSVLVVFSLLWSCVGPCSSHGAAPFETHLLKVVIKFLLCCAIPVKIAQNRRHTRSKQQKRVNYRVLTNGVLQFKDNNRRIKRAG